MQRHRPDRHGQVEARGFKQDVDAVVGETSYGWDEAVPLVQSADAAPVAEEDVAVAPVADAAVVPEEDVAAAAEVAAGSEVTEDSFDNDYFVFDLKPLAGQLGFSLQGQVGERPYTPLYSFDLAGLIAALADLASLAKFLGISLPPVPPAAPPAAPGPTGPDMLDIAAECGGEAPPEQIPETSIDDD